MPSWVCAPSTNALSTIRITPSNRGDATSVRQIPTIVTIVPDPAPLSRRTAVETDATGSSASSPATPATMRGRHVQLLVAGPPPAGRCGEEHRGRLGENLWANDIDGSALAAQPGTSQGRPLKSPGAKPIAQAAGPTCVSPNGPAQLTEPKPGHRRHRRPQQAVSCREERVSLACLGPGFPERPVGIEEF